MYQINFYFKREKSCIIWHEIYKRYTLFHYMQKEEQDTFVFITYLNLFNNI